MAILLLLSRAGFSVQLHIFDDMTLPWDDGPRKNDCVEQRGANHLLNKHKYPPEKRKKKNRKSHSAFVLHVYICGSYKYSRLTYNHLTFNEFTISRDYIVVERGAALCLLHTRYTHDELYNAHQMLHIDTGNGFRRRHSCRTIRRELRKLNSVHIARIYSHTHRDLHTFVTQEVPASVPHRRLSQ